jgi:hypothetical protein
MSLSGAMLLGIVALMLEQADTVRRKLTLERMVRV